MLSNHTIVVFEVALSLSRLIRTYSSSLHPLEWDSIYDIMAVVQRHLTLLQQKAGEETSHPKETSLPTHNLGQCLRDLYVAVEELYASGSGLSIGEPGRFFALVEENMDTMPVSAVGAAGGECIWQAVSVLEAVWLGSRGSFCAGGSFYARVQFLHWGQFLR